MAPIPIDVQANMVIKQMTVDARAEQNIIDTMNRVNAKIPGMQVSYEDTQKSMNRAGLNPFASALNMGQGGKAGGGAGGSLGAFLGLSAVIVGLTLVMKKMVDNSKIVSTVLGTINKALGLLVDVILMPFLPLIAAGLIMVFKAIMDFRTWWNELVKGKTGSTPVDTALNVIAYFLKAQFVEDWLKSVVIFLFGTQEEKAKQLNTGLYFFRIFEEAWEWLIVPLLKFFFKISEPPQFKILEFGVNVVLGTLTDMINWILRILFGEDTAPQIIKVNIDFSSNIESLIAGARSQLESLPGVRGAERAFYSWTHPKSNTGIGVFDTMLDALNEQGARNI